MEPVTVKIYLRNFLPRLNYAADLIFNSLLGIHSELVTDRRKFGKNPVINYSGEEMEGTFTVYPSGLLHETGIINRKIDITEWNNMPVFFQSENKSTIPFDIFSAVFYLVTRYEEYLNYTPDRHGRFPAQASLAYRNGFLHLPIINMWVKEFARMLVKHYPGLTFRKNKFRVLVTFDIDQPFKYKGKDILRNLKGLISDITRKQHRQSERYQIISGKNRDPWDIFDYMKEKCAEACAETIFFIPTGDRTPFDNWPSWNNQDYMNLVTELCKSSKTGMHPSYYSAENPNLLEREKERFRKISGNYPEMSRFHYVRLKFPESYRNLISAGITRDHSMGYPEEPGFRAGIAEPYYFYDLLSEKTTNLLIFPFQIMDATLTDYKNMEPDSAFKLIKDMADRVRYCGGLFQIIWHNTTLAEGEKCEEWKTVFEKTLNFLKI